MVYLCLALSAAWGLVLGYLLILDGQTRALRKRLEARASKS